MTGGLVPPVQVVGDFAECDAYYQEALQEAQTTPGKKLRSDADTPDGPRTPNGSATFGLRDRRASDEGLVGPSPRAKAPIAFLA